MLIWRNLSDETKMKAVLSRVMVIEIIYSACRFKKNGRVSELENRLCSAEEVAAEAYFPVTLSVS